MGKLYCCTTKFKSSLLTLLWGLRGVSHCLYVSKSALVKVMAGCRQATSHSLNQWRLIFMKPFGITRPQRVKKISTYGSKQIRLLVSIIQIHKALRLILVLLMPILLWNLVNTLRLRQNGRRFTDDTFKRIFLNANVRISIKISLKFVPKGQINNIPALVQIMAWHRSGDKPLYEPMMVSLLTHICVTRPQWVNLRISFR